MPEQKTNLLRLAYPAKGTSTKPAWLIYVADDLNVYVWDKDRQLPGYDKPGAFVKHTELAGDPQRIGPETLKYEALTRREAQAWIDGGNVPAVRPNALKALDSRHTLSAETVFTRISANPEVVTKGTLAMQGPSPVRRSVPGHPAIEM